MGMRRNRVTLTEAERIKFNDIGLDDINQMTHVPSLQKLMHYMEYVPRVDLSTTHHTQERS
jgi:hypothetical protein